MERKQKLKEVDNQTENELISARRTSVRIIG